MKAHVVNANYFPTPTAGRHVVARPCNGALEFGVARNSHRRTFERSDLVKDNIADVAHQKITGSLGKRIAEVFPKERSKVSVRLDVNRGLRLQERLDELLRGSHGLTAQNTDPAPREYRLQPDRHRRVRCICLVRLGVHVRASTTGTQKLLSKLCLPISRRKPQSKNR